VIVPLQCRVHGYAEQFVLSLVEPAWLLPGAVLTTFTEWAENHLFRLFAVDIHSSLAFIAVTVTVSGEGSESTTLFFHQ